LLPSTRPLPDAVIVRLLPHIAVNVPTIEFAVCEAIWYWKLPHDVGLGSVGVSDCDVQMPTSEGVLDPPAEGGGVGLGVGFDPLLVDPAFELGAVTVCACSKPQAASESEAASVTTSERNLFILVTNLS
jgi:hypothetical protein